MKLEEVLNIFKNDEELFAKITRRLDKNTKFVVLHPFKEVFTNFINNKTLLSEFIDTVRKDIQKKNLKDEKFSEEYCMAFEYNIKSFLDYYTCNDKNSEEGEEEEGEEQQEVGV